MNIQNKEIIMFFEYIDTFNLFFKELDRDLKEFGCKSTVKVFKNQELFSDKSINEKNLIVRFRTALKVVISSIKESPNSINIYSVPIFIIIAPFVYLFYRHKYIVICQGQLEGEGKLKAYIYRLILSLSVLFSYKSFTCNLVESFRWDLWPLSILSKKLTGLAWYGVSLNQEKLNSYKSFNSKRLFDPRKVKFGYLGRICNEKGCQNLIDFFLKENNHNHKLSLTGNPVSSFRKKYSWIFENQSNQIIYEKALPSEKVVNWMYDLDIYISFSKGESIGTSTLEALLAGKPVISLINSGACQILRHKVDSFIIQKLTSKEIKKAIRYVIENYESMSKSAAANQQISFQQPCELSRVILEDS